VQANINRMLQLMDRPAFCVLDGIITGANQAALGRLIPLDTPVASLISAGKEEYTTFTEGWMYLTLSLGGSFWGASVYAMEQHHIFRLDSDNTAGEYRVLSLAAQELRNPLSRILTITERLFPSLALPGDCAEAEQIARINRGLHQMMRIINNMSDASRYTTSEPHLETRDVNAVFRELFEQAGALFSFCGIDLKYSGLPSGVHSLVDSEQLERCIFNILSNCLKATPSGGSVHAALTKRENTLYLTVTDTGRGIDPEKMGDVFTRFLREPSVTDPADGLGLGMTLIRACAKAHGGTVLITPAGAAGTKITLSLPIMLNPDRLHSPRMHVDYAGERNHALIELSDSLPYNLYQIDKN